MSAASLKTTKTTKGHWPKGKPRGFVVPPARLRQVRAWFERHAVAAGPQQNERSIKRVAVAIGVSERSIRRWLLREENPNPVRWRALIAYLGELGF